MAYIQIQIATEPFLEMFRTGLRAQLLPLFASEFPQGAATILIDRVDVLPTTSVDDSRQGSVGIVWEDGRFAPWGVTDVPRTEYVIVQPLVVSPVVLLGSGTATPSLLPLGEISATLRVAVDAWSAADWVPRLFLQPEDLTLGELPTIPGIDPTRLRQLLQQQLRAFFTSSDQTLLQQDQLAAGTPWGTLEYLNTGLAMDPQKSRFGILMQSRPSRESRVPYWRIFHSRQIEDLLQGASVRRQWAQSLDAYLIEQIVIWEIEQGLRPHGGTFRATSPVGATWSNPNGGAHVSVHFFAEHNAPDPFAGTIDLDIFSEIDITAVPDDTLRLSSALRAMIKALPVGLTLLAAAGFIVSVLGIVMTVFLGPVGLVVAGLGASVARSFLGMVKDPKFPAALPGLNCTQGPIQEIGLPPPLPPFGVGFSIDVVCTKALNLTFPNGQGGAVQMLLAETRGLPGALVTAGGFRVAGNAGSEFDLQIFPFTWSAPSFPCGVWVAGTRPDSFDSSAVVARAVIQLTPRAGSKVTLLSASLRSADPRRVTSLTPDLRSVTVTVRFDRGYLSAPYPFWILLHTTGGPRLVEVAAPPVITAAEAEALVRRELAKSVSDCNALSDPFYRGSRVNPKWLPDPPFDLSEANFLWVVRAHGLQTNEPVVITDSGGSVLATVHANGRGRSTFIGLVTPQLGTKLGLSLAPSAGGTPRAAIALPKHGAPHPALHARYLEIEQTLLIRRAIVDLRAPINQFRLDPLNNRSGLIVTRADWVDVLDLSELSAPRVIASLPTKGSRGAIAAGGGLLVWGEAGLHYHELGTKPARRPVAGDCTTAGCLCRREVRAVHRFVERFVILTDLGLEILDIGASSPVLIREGNFTDCAVAGSSAFLLHGDHVDVLDLAGKDGRVSHLDCPGTTRLIAPTLDSEGSHLYTALRKGGIVWDVGDPVHPEAIARFDTDPEWVSARRHGSLVANQMEDGAIALFSATTVVRH